MRSFLLLVISMLCASQLAAMAMATPVVQNPGFEDATTPSLSNGQVMYTPPFGGLTTVPGWTFGPSDAGGTQTSYDGMSQGMTFTNENHGAAGGDQNAFVQGTGTLSQSINFTPGNYTFSVDAISRTNSGESTPEPTAVTLGSQTLTFGGVGDFQAGTTGWSTFTSDVFHIATSGAYTLSINGTVPLTVNDNLTGIDNVQFSVVTPEPASLVMCGLGAIGLLFAARFRRRS